MRMKSIRRKFFLALFLSICIVVHAQDLVVQGTVLSAVDNFPVIGATVVEDGNNTNGTITDLDGKFTLSVSKGGSITVSFVGFKTQTLKAENVMNILLHEDSEVLDEVVVTGYTTQRKADLTGAVSVVSMDEISKQNENNPMKALQGRVPGMNITADGNPSGSTTIRIRGIGTLNNNDPLYIIDGVPTKGGMHELNGNDIESIQVLKDAASASIYGSRAANGVIIVTTKKGKEGQIKVNFDASVSASMFDKEYWFDFTANVWTYVGKNATNKVDFNTKTYSTAVEGFTAKDITNIFDIMQHPSKYADSNNVIRLFPVFSNGKNYNSSLTDGGRDSLRADFKYKSNTSTITNSINPTSTKLTYSSVTYYTSASGNDLSLPSYSYDVNYAVLNNVDLKKDKYDSITIKMAPAYGIHNWGQKDWSDLYSISGSVIEKFVNKFGEGLYTFYLFIGNSASHNGPQSNTTPFPTIGEDSLISYITNDLNYSSNELKFKHLNGIVDSSNNYNISATSSFYFFSSSEAGYGTIGAYDRPIGLAVEKVTNLRLVTDIPIDDGGNQDWGSIDSNVEQGLINAQNFTIADDVYKIESDDYLDEDFKNPIGTPIDSTNPYIYIIQNADFRFVNNLYFQIRFSNKYIDGGMNVTTDYQYVADPAKTPKYLAYKIQDQLIKFKFQDTLDKDVFIENATVKGSGGVTRDGFKLKDYNARGIYDILLVTTSVEDGKQAMNMYVNRHTNSFIKLFNGYPGTFKDEINLGETSVDDIFVRHKLPSEDANQARLNSSQLLWNGQTYLGEYLTSNSKGDEYVKNDDTTEETPSGESISFLKAIKNELGVTPGNDTIYPIKDAVTGRAIAYYNSGVGRLYTNEGSVFDDETGLNLFTIMKNYVLYIERLESFYGTWTGVLGGMNPSDVTIVINDDMTGSYNGRSFNYRVKGNKIFGTTDDGTYEIIITYIPETQKIEVHVQDPSGDHAFSGTLSDYTPAEGDSSETTPESFSL